MIEERASVDNEGKYWLDAGGKAKKKGEDKEV